MAFEIPPARFKSTPGLLNVEGAKRDSGTSPETVRKWAREGRLRHVRFEHAIKLDRHRIPDWIRAEEMAVPLEGYRASRR